MSNGSILSAIKEQSNHRYCYADTEIEAVNYEPRISENTECFATRRFDFIKNYALQ